MYENFHNCTVQSVLSRLYDWARWCQTIMKFKRILLSWFCLRHFTAFHYHHHTRLLMDNFGHWTHVNVCRVSCGGVVNMLLVLSITSYFHYNIWGCMCSTDPFQYRWLKGFIYSSCYYHHQIGSIHLSYCYHIFRGCVSEMFVASYSVTYCIYIPEICFHYYCAVYDVRWVQIIGYVFFRKSHSFVCTLHHLIIVIVQIYLKTLKL